MAKGLVNSRILIDLDPLAVKALLGEPSEQRDNGTFEYKVGDGSILGASAAKFSLDVHFGPSGRVRSVTEPHPNHQGEQDSH